MRITKLFNDFFESGKSGVLLIVCTLISMLLSNTSVGEDYQHFWHLQVGMLKVEQWVNDGLMVIFFFMIGLELKRELYVGELSSRKTGLLPVFAAIGGMLLPAIIYLSLNFDKSSASGFGIPMATDIAFAIGILSLLGDRVPTSLKVFLTAIAVIDDLGAILVIAFFYTESLSLLNLGIVAAIFFLLLFLAKKKVNSLPVYIAVGVLLWYFMLQSGVHATLAGILLAFVLPFGNGSKDALSYKVQSWLHKPVSFVVLPIFALANTAIDFSAGWDKGLWTASGLGIILGLVIGKPLGVSLFSYISIKFKLTALGGSLNWKQVWGAGLLAGIGFTMSIFITLLAFNDEFIIKESKIAILLASLIAGILGYSWLNIILKKKNFNNIIHKNSDANVQST